MAVIGTNLFAGTNNGGVYMTNNYGTNWISVNNGIPTQYIGIIISTGSNLFSGTAAGTYFSPDNGTNWISKNQGISSTDSVNALIISNNYIFAGVASKFIWRRLYSEAVQVQNISGVVPDNYYLSQNYPNPFNPTTNIYYQISNNSFVSLKIYNITGEEISTLVNQKQEAGSYQVTFDGSSLASGIYFYKIKAGSFSVTKKMSLIK
jgi:hypothetical protein